MRMCGDTGNGSNCKKRPSYNYVGKSKAIYCKTCKLPGMINVISRKCRGGCGKRPIFNYPGETKLLYCNQCKKEGMVNIMDKKCKGGCGKIANYNYSGEPKLYCSVCKHEGMVNVTLNRRSGGIKKAKAKSGQQFTTTAFVANCYFDYQKKKGTSESSFQLKKETSTSSVFTENSEHSDLGDSDDCYNSIVFHRSHSEH
eukprot:Pgem_evm1s3377